MSQTAAPIPESEAPEASISEVVPSPPGSFVWEVDDPFDPKSPYEMRRTSPEEDFPSGKA
jgi:hypothetical protein